MENSPLELYEKAYRLHYLENKIPEACQIYDSIIKEFPESNECGYAVIQLQKVQSNLVSETSLKIQNKLHPLVIITLILNLLIAVALVVLAGFYLNTKENQLYYISSLSRAIVKAQIGQDQEALDILGELKVNSHGDLTPYLLSADIFRANQQFQLAIEELDSMQKQYPNTGILKKEIQKIQEEKIMNQSRKKVQIEQPKDTVEGAPANRPKLTKSKRPSIRRSASRSKRNKTPPRLLINEDSISFF